MLLELRGVWTRGVNESVKVWDMKERIQPCGEVGEVLLELRGVWTRGLEAWGVIVWMWGVKERMRCVCVCVCACKV